MSSSLFLLSIVSSHHLAAPTMPAKIFRDLQLYFCNDFLFKCFFFWKYATRSAGMFFCISIFFILPFQQCMQRYSVTYSCIFVIIFFLCFLSGNMLVEVLACFFVFLFLYHAVPTMPAKIFREIQLYFCNDFLFKRFFSGNMLVQVLACFFVFLFLYLAAPTTPAKIFGEIRQIF